MLRIANLSKNLPMSLDMAEEDEMIDKSAIDQAQIDYQRTHQYY